MIGEKFFVSARAFGKYPQVVTVVKANSKFVTTDDGRKWNVRGLREWGEDYYRAAELRPWNEAQAVKYEALVAAEQAQRTVRDAWDMLGDRRNLVKFGADDVERAQEAARLTAEYVEAMWRLGLLPAA